MFRLGISGISYRETRYLHAPGQFLSNKRTDNQRLLVGSPPGQEEGMPETPVYLHTFSPLWTCVGAETGTLDKADIMVNATCSPQSSFLEYLQVCVNVKCCSECRFICLIIPHLNAVAPCVSNVFKWTTVLVQANRNRYCMGSSCAPLPKPARSIVTQRKTLRLCVVGYVREEGKIGRPRHKSPAKC